MKPNNQVFKKKDPLQSRVTDKIEPNQTSNDFCSKLEEEIKRLEGNLETSGIRYHTNYQLNSRISILVELASASQ